MTAKNSNIAAQSEHQLESADVSNTMSSVEVAKLTGKLHKHVVRDVRSMLVELDDPNMDHDQYQEIKDVRGYTKEFQLNEELTLTLVSGYSVKMRNAIIKRWKELERNESESFYRSLPGSATPIVYQGKIILMIHQQRGDFVSLRSLCDVTQLDYTRCVRNLKRDEHNYREIMQDGEKVLCLSYQSSIEWLENLKPVNVQLKKRYIVVEAMLNVPKLLKKAREAYRAAVKEIKLIPHTSKDMAALIEQLEKMAGHRLAIVPVDKLMEANSKVDSAVRNSFMNSQKLLHDLLNSGETAGSLRAGA